jgi:CRP-like cAMP-binding protein
LLFVDNDAALEWCEDRLLGTAGFSLRSAADTRLEDFDLLEGLDKLELSAIESAVDIRTMEAGTVLFREGDVANSIFFLLAGRVSVLLPLDARANDRKRRLATFGEGVAFGEMALLDEGERSADVVCDEESEVAVLSLAALRRLEEEHVTMRQRIRENLARVLARRLRAANAQIRALAR